MLPKANPKMTIVTVCRCGSFGGSNRNRRRGCLRFKFMHILDTRLLKPAFCKEKIYITYYKVCVRINSKYEVVPA